MGESVALSLLLVAARCQPWPPPPPSAPPVGSGRKGERPLCRRSEGGGEGKRVDLGGRSERVKRGKEGKGVDRDKGWVADIIRPDGFLQVENLNFGM